MSNAFAGVGTKFQRGNGASAETFADIAEVNSIEGPGMTRERYDTTSLDTSGGYRTYIGGFRDGGEITLTMNFVPTDYDLFLTDYEDDEAHNYKIIWSDPGAATMTFSAFVMNIPISTVADDKVTATITLQVTGPVTFTP